MAIILVRHGETALNAARIMQPAATPLSERGQAQARAVAQRLARRGGVGAIVSSDLPRAWLTAEAIAAALALPIQPSALLQERNFGDLRGRPYDSLGFDPLRMQHAPPGGESAAEFLQRVQQAFDDMLQRHQGLEGDLVVVTHGLLIRTLLSGPWLAGAGTLGDLHLGNTSLSIFDAAPPHALQLLNCTRHLDAAERDDARSLSGG
ncbi:MAG: histidine phosphatase family protein [Burkholderiaceae bacterium]|nr:histidine phosphatase family protein [Burkholderiaceae bacterium]